MTFSQAKANEQGTKRERGGRERGDIMRKVEEDCHGDMTGH